MKNFATQELMEEMIVKTVIRLEGRSCDSQQNRCSFSNSCIVRHSVSCFLMQTNYSRGQKFKTTFLKLDFYKIIFKNIANVF